MNALKGTKNEGMHRHAVLEAVFKHHRVSEMGELPWVQVVVVAGYMGLPCTPLPLGSSLAGFQQPLPADA